ncbi:uncharacterized protein LOC142548173 isoform X1 [Primulina tabacum]|uniref:uncharacterized protein LOC142548173 isoform X1 n=1 Tax=Primulina tabacum TaxID=48773 RepID=UPI003F590817
MMEKEEDVNVYSPEEIKEKNEEKMKIGLMRNIVEKQVSGCKQQDVDDSTLRRFLRARDLDVEKASAMFLNYRKWKQTFIPKGFVSASEVGNEIAQNKMFKQGTDKKGQPIAVVFGARHFKCKGGIDEFKRFLVFSLDKLCSRITDGPEKFIIIGDLKGYGYRNSDVRGYLAALSILQDYYPERLGKVLVINAPNIFMTLWKIIYPFIDKNTRNKIVFVDNKRMKATLLEDIEECQLPEIYGGKLQLVPIQDC